jgi:hypothetical protein
MADLVGQHVGLGEVAGGVEAGQELLEEVQIEVGVLVEGAVVRSDGGGGAATSALGAACEQDEFRPVVVLAGRGELVGPVLLDVVEDEAEERDEFRVRVLGPVEGVGRFGDRVGSLGARSTGRCRWFQLLGRK